MNYAQLYKDIDDIRQQRGMPWIAVFLATGVHDVPRRMQQSLDGWPGQEMSREDCQKIAEWAGLDIAHYESEESV